MIGLWLQNLLGAVVKRNYHVPSICIQRDDADAFLAFALANCDDSL